MCTIQIMCIVLTHLLGNQSNYCITSTANNRKDRGMGSIWHAQCQKQEICFEEKKSQQENFTIISILFSKYETYASTFCHSPFSFENGCYGEQWEQIILNHSAKEMYRCLPRSSDKCYIQSLSWIESGWMCILGHFKLLCHPTTETSFQVPLISIPQLTW